MNDFLKLPCTPTLSREDEVYLFTQLRRAENAIKDLGGRKRKRTADESSQLGTARHVVKDCTDRICTAHTALVIRLAGRFANTTVTKDDLVSDGLMKMLDCIRLFNIAQDVRFCTYLWRSLASTFLRSRSKVARAQRHRIIAEEEREDPLLSVSAPEEADGQADQLIELREALKTNKAKLTKNERRVLRLSLEKSQHEITMITGFSKRIQQELRESAIEKLRRVLSE